MPDAISVLVILGPVRRFGEFARAEGCKGYWASLQQFEKHHGRYPTNESELATFFHTVPANDPVLYVPPTDEAVDEVILWWKERTMFGVRVGITESGEIAKE